MFAKIPLRRIENWPWRSCFDQY